MFDAAGGEQGGLARRLSAGNHRIDLTEAMTSSEPRPGLHFMVLHIGNQAFTHSVLLSGKGAAGMVFAPAYRNEPAGNLGPSDPEIRRHGSALYEIKTPDGKLEGYLPAIVFAESLFLAPIMGKSFEGLIAQRTAAGRYDLTPTLPVRVQVSSGRFQGKTDAVSGFQVKATIANLANPIAAADGTCMPSLSSHGSKAPFDAGTEVYLLVERFISMHGFGGGGACTP